MSNNTKLTPTLPHQCQLPYTAPLHSSTKWQLRHLQPWQPQTQNYFSLATSILTLHAAWLSCYHSVPSTLCKPCFWSRGPEAGRKAGPGWPEEMDTWADVVSWVWFSTWVGANATSRWDVPKVKGGLSLLFQRVGANYDLSHLDAS